MAFKLEAAISQSESYASWTAAALSALAQKKAQTMRSGPVNPPFEEVEETTGAKNTARLEACSLSPAINQSWPKMLHCNNILSFGIPEDLAEVQTIALRRSIPTSSPTPKAAQRSHEN